MPLKVRKAYLISSDRDDSGKRPCVPLLLELAVRTRHVVAFALCFCAAASVLALAQLNFDSRPSKSVKITAISTFRVSVRLRVRSPSATVYRMTTMVLDTIRLSSMYLTAALRICKAPWRDVPLRATKSRLRLD